MSIFSNEKNPDKWKNKYFNLLDESDEVEKNFQSKEGLLCKIIARLALATTGLNKPLDPHLLRLRKQLKKGLKSEALKLELEKFSNALMTLEEVIPEDLLPEAGLLFDFLFHHFPEQKKEIQRIEVKYEKKGYANSQYMIIAINDLIDTIQHIEPVTELPVEINTLSVDSESINTQIQRLLEDMDIPAQFESQVEGLKQKLFVGHTSMTNILDETISLLFQIKKHLQIEQQEIAVFLTELNEQLTDLGIKATGVKHVSETQGEKRNLLDKTVSSQMIALQKNSKNATQLEPLKKLVYSQLEDISQQIQGQRAEDEYERIKVNKELDFLTSKISSMELEAKQLSNKLKSAHHRATHDPLTGLSNRLAYDDRVTIEVARWQRYKTPLSLLIWDIDFFKRINDTFGHKAGDKTLILIAQLLSQHCRETDFVSRFGGEEFTMLLSDTDANSALETANNLRQIVEKTAFNSNGKKISITISCGITQFAVDDSHELAFNRADTALYEAKKNGRNQCVIN